MVTGTSNFSHQRQNSDLTVNCGQIRQSSIDAPDSEAYRIMLDGKPVGGVVLKINTETKHNELELLFVSPDAHSKGIGYSAWKAVEALHPETKGTSFVIMAREVFYVSRVSSSQSDCWGFCRSYRYLWRKTMDYSRINTSQIDLLWELQKLYKTEIGEYEPENAEKERLAGAINKGRIFFYGAWEGEDLVGCCSVTVGFSTFNYMPSGVFEDFYIRPQYRHKGIARQLVQFAHRESGVSSLTVGCADCDVPMYQSLGFSISLGNLLAFE